MDRVPSLAFSSKGSGFAWPLRRRDRGKEPLSDSNPSWVGGGKEVSFPLPLQVQTSGDGYHILQDSDLGPPREPEPVARRGVEKGSGQVLGGAGSRNGRD